MMKLPESSEERWYVMPVKMGGKIEGINFGGVAVPRLLLIRPAAFISGRTQSQTGESEE
ncbi:MAG: hypothetical protein JW841_10905 [Deltaproteobacteria bacterium]|nr:hypothetical protein [Deltaproteobacteria bacterium]